MKLLIALLLTTLLYSNSCILEDMEVGYRVIANVEQGTIQRSELARLFSGRTDFWPNGERVMVYVRPFNDPIQNSMVQSLLGISANTFHQFTKRNPRMEVVPTDKILSKVLNRPGAVGVIDEHIIYLNLDSRLKLLRVLDE